MKTFRQDIWQQGEYSYPAAYGFVPNIRAYLHDDDSVRDCMLVVPGGGYCMVVPPEAEIVAKTFYEQGMNAFVLTYTTDITMCVPLKKQPLRDISRAVRLIRKNAEAYKINPNKLIVCGFSAGGHVCGTLCTHFDDAPDNEEYSKYSNRPDGAILSYPVITTGEFTHIYSCIALYGNDVSQEEKDYYSVEKNVTPNTPPCFIWQTAKDGLVPVENSYLMAKALKEKGVPFAHYVFPNGDHGLSIATEDFFKGVFGEPYTMEQLGKALEHVKAGTAVNLNERRREELFNQFNLNAKTDEGAASTDKEEAKNSEKNDETAGNSEAKPFENLYADVAIWPELAKVWISRL